MSEEEKIIELILKHRKDIIDHPSKKLEVIERYRNKNRDFMKIVSEVLTAEYESIQRYYANNLAKCETIDNWVRFKIYNDIGAIEKNVPLSSFLAFEEFMGFGPYKERFDKRLSEYKQMIPNIVLLLSANSKEFQLELIKSYFPHDTSLKRMRPKDLDQNFFANIACFYLIYDKETNYVPSDCNYAVATVVIDIILIVGGCVSLRSTLNVKTVQKVFKIIEPIFKQIAELINLLKEETDTKKIAQYIGQILFKLKKKDYLEGILGAIGEDVSVGDWVILAGVLTLNIGAAFATGGASIPLSIAVLALDAYFLLSDVKIVFDKCRI